MPESTTPDTNNTPALGVARAGAQVNESLSALSAWLLSVRGKTVTDAEFGRALDILCELRRALDAARSKRASPEPEPGIYTTGQVAKICQVAPRTVSKWFDQGKIKGYREPTTGDRWIPHAELVRFLEENGMLDLPLEKPQQ